MSKKLTIDDAQYKQPWTVPYSDAVVTAQENGVPHILGTHAVLHGMKSLGKIAAIYEKLDHSEELPVLDDLIIVENMAADLMTIALRFANLHGFSLSKALIRRVVEKNGVAHFPEGSGDEQETIRV